jgi:hypothetical protein
MSTATKRPPGGDQAEIKAACEYPLSSLTDPPSLGQPH